MLINNNVLQSNNYFSVQGRGTKKILHSKRTSLLRGGEGGDPFPLREGEGGEKVLGIS